MRRLNARECVAFPALDLERKILFQQARNEGDLPPDADEGLLARYLMSVENGIAVQVADGADSEELHRVVDAALHHWPPA